MPRWSALAAAVMFGGMTLSPAVADEFRPVKRAHVRAARAAEIYCGCCGCLHVGYAYHRELRSTYGVKFDPRNFDQTEPYYYLGRVRAYPRYWIDPGPPAAQYP
jgi:hypothetical protein